ncbi:MAG: endo alpha-1,4 polygalactosaminidase [Micropepsaceae bacterium]
MRIFLVMLVAMAGFPAMATAESPRIELSSVHDWLLLLNNDLEADVVAKIAASDYDMIVIDDVSSQKGNDATKSSSVVARLREKADGSPRLVFAYLNIGQAEDYRRYWKTGWRAGAPGFILGTDPEGWQGNYPVAYWRKAWKSRITGPDGILHQIQRAGFDGVYLDWIGGYEDEHVLAAARRDHINARSEMIKWVADISRTAKRNSRAFLIIAQNAAGLLADDAYVGAIDGVAHEDIWFTGADGGPSGDCPVPRSQTELSARSFLLRLDDECLRAFRANVAGAMHFPAYEAVVPVLQAVLRKAKPVFTVDYARRLNNVNEVQRESRALGFVPFVGLRELSSYVAPVDALD